MSKPESLMDLYIDELKDLWSANDQMARALKKIATKGTNEDLKQLLADAPEGIAEHTAMLKDLITSHDEKVSKEHCKGMEGLAAEAIKHTDRRGTGQGPPPRRRHHHAVPAHDALRHHWLRDGGRLGEGVGL